MKVIRSNKTNHDECPHCGSMFVSFDGRRVICPSCVVVYISKLERENAELRKELNKLRNVIKKLPEIERNYRIKNLPEALVAGNKGDK